MVPMSENTMTAEQATISVLAEDAARTIATLMTKNAEQRVRILQLEQAVEQLQAELAAARQPDVDLTDAQEGDEPTSWA